MKFSLRPLVLVFIPLRREKGARIDQIGVPAT